MNKYSPKIDLKNTNSSQTKIINLVGKNKKVIEFGCAGGHMSEILSKKYNCAIVGIEIDEKEAQKAQPYCKEVIIGDIESFDWYKKLSGTYFDVAIFADVLEHLKDPKTVLIKVKDLLKDDGYILVSVPNIAHISIRLELLSGSFKYENLGILDDSHLKYFTLNSIIQLIEESGFFIEHFDYVVKDFPDAIIADTFRKLDLVPTQKTIDSLSTVDSIAFQWIVKAWSREPDAYTKYIFKETVKPERLAEKVYHSHISQIEMAEKQLIQADKWLRQKDLQIQEKNFKISELLKQIQQLDSQNHEQTILFQEINRKFQKQSALLQEKNRQIQEQQRQIQKIHTDLLNSISELNSIKQSRVWRIAEFFRVIFYVKMLGKFPLLQKIALNWSQNHKKIKESHYNNLIGFLKQRKVKNHLSKRSINRIKFHKNIKPIKKKISLIIPTKNAGPDFPYTLEKIKHQKGIKEIELIIVDSGSTDETVSLAERNGASVYRIMPDEFNHGLTRNYGASKSSGDYVLFMVQDVIPIGEYWLYNIIKAFECDPQIAAVTCRQIPKSDADLFACSSIWNHYKYLQFDRDKITDIRKEEFAKLSFDDKRKLAGIDDVCSCYKRSTFDKFKFRETNYAEDLDIGIRFIEKGYKIYFLYSTGVIHSHSREPEYFLRRSYVDTKSLINFFEQPPSSVNFKDVDLVLIELNYLYQSLRGTLYSVNLKFQDEVDIDFIFSEIKDGLFKKYQYTTPEEFQDLKFEKLLFKPSDIREPIDTHHLILYENFIPLLNSFQGYLKSTYQNYHVKDLISPIYKLFSIYYGSSLGYTYFYNFANNKMIRIEESLSRDI